MTVDEMHRKRLPAVVGMHPISSEQLVREISEDYVVTEKDDITQGRKFWEAYGKKAALALTRNRTNPKRNTRIANEFKYRNLQATMFPVAYSRFLEKWEREKTGNLFGHDTKFTEWNNAYSGWTQENVLAISEKRMQKRATDKKVDVADNFKKVFEGGFTS